MTDGLKELESMVARIDQRLVEIREELDAIESAKIKKEDLTTALSSFMPIWDELYPAEKTRIINLLVERVEYNARCGETRISMCPFRLKNLADK